VKIKTQAIRHLDHGKLVMSLKTDFTKGRWVQECQLSWQILICYPSRNSSSVVRILTLISLYPEVVARTFTLNFADRMVNSSRKLSGAIYLPLSSVHFLS